MDDRLLDSLPGPPGPGSRVFLGAAGVGLGRAGASLRRAAHGGSRPPGRAGNPGPPRRLAAANTSIKENCGKVGAWLADIHGAFHGHEDEYLCLEIEPTLKGAEVIAGLFRKAYETWNRR